MQRYYYFLPIFLFRFFTCPNIYAQEDSALHVYQQAVIRAKENNNHDAQFAALHDKGKVFTAKGSYAEALPYFQEGLELSNMLKIKPRMMLFSGLVGYCHIMMNNFPKARDYLVAFAEMAEDEPMTSNIAAKYNLLACAYDAMTNYPEAILYFQKSADGYHALNDAGFEGVNLNGEGTVYFNTGDFPKALQYFQRALKLAEQIDNKYDIGNNLSNIGMVYASMSDYDAALNNFYKVLKTSTNKETIAGVEQNIGSVYMLQKKYHDALEHLTRGHVLDSARGAYLGLNCKSLATIYLLLNDTGKALYYAEKGKEIAVKAEDKSVVSGIYTILGQLNIGQKNYPLALDYLYKAKVMADQAGVAEVQMDVAASISEAYSAIRRTDSAFIFYKKYIALRDSMSNDEKRKQITRLSVGYEYNKREDSLKYQQQLERVTYEQNQRLSSAQLVQQQQQLKLRQAALNLSDQQLSISRQEQQLQSLAFEKQQGEYSRVQKEKDNQLKLAAQQSRIQQLEIQNNQRTRLALLGGLLLLGSIAVFSIMQSNLRKKANTQLTQSNQQLDEANRVKARFFGILSHDLRAPISNLTSYLHLQREAPEMMEANDRAKHQLTIENAANNLLSVMEDLLLWSKGQMTSFKPQIKSVPVLQLFDEIKKLIPHNTLVEVVFSDPGLLAMDTDENFLKTIMRNLTANALKALNNHPNGKVEWKAWEADGKKYLSVTDNGPGLTKEQLENLFSESSVTSAKTGLGLHIVRDFAQMLGQKIEVASELGKGTLFTLSKAA